MCNFINSKDKEHLSKYEIDTDKDIPIFVREMRDYFYETWREEFKPEINILDDGDINTLNDIIGFPSTSARMILDDSFTGSNLDVDILCSNSKLILSYFYGISLR